MKFEVSSTLLRQYAVIVTGLGSVLWLGVGELFTDVARAFGVSAALTGTAALAFLTIKYFPIVTSTLGASTTYWIFSALNILVVVLIVIFLPETNGKSYVEIQESLGRKFDEITRVEGKI